MRFVSSKIYLWRGCSEQIDRRPRRMHESDLDSAPSFIKRISVGAPDKWMSTVHVILVKNFVFSFLSSRHTLLCAIYYFGTAYHYYYLRLIHAHEKYISPIKYINWPAAMQLLFYVFPYTHSQLTIHMVCFVNEPFLILLLIYIQLRFIGIMI